MSTTIDECAICQISLSIGSIGVFNCGHCFHIDCINELFSTESKCRVYEEHKCPICMTYIKGYYHIYGLFNTNIEKSNKSMFTVHQCVLFIDVQDVDQMDEEELRTFCKVYEIMSFCRIL